MKYFFTFFYLSNSFKINIKLKKINPNLNNKNLLNFHNYENEFLNIYELKKFKT
jgi:hypothetical protein